MIAEKQKLGKYWIPGSFPTQEVLNHMRGGTFHGFWSRSMVNDVYDSYYKAVKDNGFLPYQWTDKSGKINFAVRDEIVRDLQLDETDIAAVLKSIHDLAKSGQIDNKWWDPRKRTGIQLPSEIKNLTKTIKFAGVAAIILVALYFSYPYLKKLRRSK